jgi:hypothetical protein
MLRRAKRLQSIFDQYSQEYGHPHLKLDQDEWRQVDYLLQLTQPFFRFTTALSKTKDITIHTVFSIYNRLFNHLEVSINQLQQKKVLWKQLMLSALDAAKDKLSAYYGKTTQEHGYLYAMGTILAPQYKLQFFSDISWSENNYEWRQKYHNHLQDYIKPYEQQLSKDQSVPGPQSQRVHTSELDILLAPAETIRPTQRHKNEITKYLGSGM